LEEISWGLYVCFIFFTTSVQNILWQWILSHAHVTTEMCTEMQQNIYVNSIILYLILIKMDWSDNIQWKSAIVNVENNIQLTVPMLHTRPKTDIQTERCDPNRRHSATSLHQLWRDCTEPTINVEKWQLCLLEGIMLLRSDA